MDILQIALSPRDDFQDRHAFYAVGSGSNRTVPALYIGSGGRELQPTGPNYNVLLVHQHSSSLPSTQLFATIFTRQVATWARLALEVWEARPFRSRSSKAPSQEIPIGSRIDRIRDQLGITMTQLAAALLLQRGTLYKWYQGRQPHPGNEARLDAIEAFAEAWAAQKLPPLRRFWAARIAGTAVRVQDVLCDPLCSETALLASLPNIRAASPADPPIDLYTPRQRVGSLGPSAFEETAPPLWERDD